MTEARKKEENRQAAERMKILRRRKKQHESEQQKKNRKEYERMRKRRLREKKKEENERETGVFRTPQLEGKAVSRVRQSLPKDPMKRKKVVKRLAEEERLVVKKTDPFKRHGNALAEAVIKTVKDFYCDDMTSRIYADTRKFKNVKNPDGSKEKIQKRLLLYNLKDAHCLFKERHPDISISLSKFCNLRPSHIETVSEKDHSVCCCPYHENFSYMIQALGCRSNIEDFLEDFACNTESAECMFSTCENCSVIDVSELVNTEPYEVYMWNGPKLEKVSTNTLLKLFP